MYHTVQILTLLIIAQSAVQCQYGATCKGVCMELADCPYQFQDAKNRALRHSCANNGREPLVCCNPEPGLRSKQKCKEYNQLKSSLGRVDKAEMEKNIIKEFPHAVVLGYEENRAVNRSISWRCGGILISEDYVLTAAHCVVNPVNPLKFVRMGTAKMENPEAQGNPQDFEISEIIVHPSYNISSNDIALVKLNMSAVFNSFVQPACLQTDFEIRPLNYTVTAWEYLDYGLLGRLVKEDFVPFSLDRCLRIYEASPYSREILEDYHICEIPAGPQKIECSYYSGRFLQSQRDGSYHVVGLGSFGTGCASSQSPAVYTRVSKYISWIEDIVWSIPK